MTQQSMLAVLACLLLTDTHLGNLQMPAMTLEPEIHGQECK